MTREAQRIERVRDLIGGTPDYSTGLLSSRGVHPIDIALQHAEEWVDAHPPRGEERGGSSSPTEIEERQEVARVSRLASKALIEIPLLTRELEDAAEKLRDYTVRLTAVIDLTQLPKSEQRDDECASCRRSEQKGRERIGDHFSPVYVKAPLMGLCRWCRDHALPVGDEMTLPPVEACHIMHTQSARAASMWLDKYRAKAA